HYIVSSQRQLRPSNTSLFTGWTAREVRPKRAQFESAGEEVEVADASAYLRIKTALLSLRYFSTALRLEREVGARFASAFSNLYSTSNLPTELTSSCAFCIFQI